MTNVVARDFVELAERRYDIDWDAIRSSVSRIVKPAQPLPAALMDPRQAPSYWCVPVLVGDYCGASSAAVTADLERYASACLVRHFHYEPGNPLTPEDDLVAMIGDGYAAGRLRAGSFADRFAAKCQSWTVVLTYGTRQLAAEAARPTDHADALAAIVSVYSCTQLLDDWHDRNDDLVRGHWNVWSDEPVGVSLRAVDPLLRDAARELGRLRSHPLRDALVAQLRDTAAELADVVALLGRKAPGGPASPVESGVGYLLRRLGAEATGLWTDFRTPGVSAGSTECVSAFIATLLAPIPSGRPAARAVASTLLVHSRPSGGWGYRADVVEDADSTAWVVLSAMAARVAPPPGLIRRSQTYLLSHLTDEGGFATYSRDERRQLTTDLPEWSTAEPSVTCSALLALVATGWHDDRVIRAGCDFVAQHCTDAGWPSMWWQGAAYGTWLAVWALTELGGGRYRGEFGRVRGHLLATRRADGSWGEAGPNGFDTALAVLTLLRLDRPEDAAVIREAASALATLPRATGGWSGGAQMLAPGAQPLGLVLCDELVTTACAVAALHGMGTPPM